MLARLFYAPPDTALLEALAGDGQLDTDESTRSPVRGKPWWRRPLYTTAYTHRNADAARLAWLRADLAALGLCRHEASREPQDHFAALCETMRHLIAMQKLGLGHQMRFFDRSIDPAARPLCDAISRPRCGAFYESVGRFARVFFELERSAFEMPSKSPDRSLN